MKNVFALLAFAVVYPTVHAQIPSGGFSGEPLSPLERKLNARSSAEHTAIQPAARGLEQTYFVLGDSLRSADLYTTSLRVEPIADLSAGYASGNSSRATWSGYAGAHLKWHYRDKVSASAGYALAGGLLPEYMVRLADSLRVIPGLGYAVRDQRNLYHTHFAFGHIGYKAGKYFHFELGQGRHFWGDGYRSLILGNQVSPYPYLRIDTRIWRIKYTNLWIRLGDMSEGQLYGSRRGKYAALHGLSWNVSKKLTFNLYEMVVWQDRDTLSRRHLDMNYLNPIIFYRPVEFSQGSADNVLIGFGFKWKGTDELQVYGQFVLDEFLFNNVRARNGWWANKYGGQIGVKLFDAVIPGLHFQLEVNAVRPFTYTHGSPVQAWGHMNQPLAHPYGANFYESLFFARYEWKDWVFSEQFTWGQFGRDPQGKRMGGDIFRSYKGPYQTYDNVTLQGDKHILHYHQLRVARKLKKWPAMEVYFSHVLRYESTKSGSHTDNILMLGLRRQGFLSNRVDF